MKTDFHLISSRVAICKIDSRARRLWRLHLVARLKPSRLIATKAIFARYSETPARLRAINRFREIAMGRYIAFISYCESIK